MSILKNRRSWLISI